MSTPILSTEGLSRQFVGLLAVDEISMAVDHGEIYGVIGPNGAGKSTLFNVIAGVIPPSAGSVMFQGRRIDRLPPHRRNWLGLARTFQAAQAFSSQSVLESMVTATASRRRGMAGWLGPAHRREDVKQATEVATFVGLEDSLGLVPAELSNLQQQILGIGLALATDCEVLLLDEPSGGLIESEVNHLVALIRRIRDRGITVVVIDHKMRMMMQLCDRILVMANGRQIALGTPEEIAAHEEVINSYLGRPRSTNKEAGS